MPISPSSPRYVVVAPGATMLVGSGTIFDEKEVALPIAGQQASGMTGLVAVTLAATSATASTIDATLFPPQA